MNLSKVRHMKLQCGTIVYQPVEFSPSYNRHWWFTAKFDRQWNDAGRSWYNVSFSNDGVVLCNGSAYGEQAQVLALFKTLRPKALDCKCPPDKRRTFVMMYSTRNVCTVCRKRH